MTLTGVTNAPIKKTKKKNVYKFYEHKIRVYKDKIKVTGGEKDSCIGTYRLKKRYVS